MNREFLDKIEQADLVLIGLGEEFNEVRQLRRIKGYAELRDDLKASETSWLVPSLNTFFREEIQDTAYNCLCRLAQVLENKNYYIISVATNERIMDVPWKEGRVVMPCGSNNKKQCKNGCENTLLETTEEDEKTIQKYFCYSYRRQKEGMDFVKWTDGSIGMCSECGSPLVLNNIYAGNYNENGYLEQWQHYTKWLQGTLNKKLFLLELGVGLQFPSVIRWPFEKITFLNKKADFYRVNEKLYQLSEELRGKGVSISENAIDWLGNL